MNKPVRYPDAWSYSAYADYQLCPFKYHGRKILKLPEAPSPSLVDGRVFHDQVAKHITVPGAPAPDRPIHKRIQPIVEQLRQMDDKIVEQQWAFTPQWKSTGWFSRNPQKPTWLRVILDVGLVYADDTATVVDWKTGKQYSTNQEQMEIFAVATFNYFPSVKALDTRLLYVDSGAEEVAEFKRSEEAALRAKWEEKARVMLSDRTWAPKPNDKCHFCVRARQNDGDCRFG